MRSIMIGSQTASRKAVCDLGHVAKLTQIYLRVVRLRQPHSPSRALDACGSKNAVFRLA
jgi:hypothetical protein